MSNDRIFETWGEVAEALGCSESWARKLWGRLKFRLEHRLCPKGRIRMTEGEMERFKERIQEGRESGAIA